MKRKIDAYLKDWAQSDEGSPLLIRGARRVGKTFAIKHLGESQFGADDFAYCDFQTELQSLTQLFDEARNVEDVIGALSLFLHQDILPKRTLIAFDEIQLCEKALNFLRFFAESDYRVIATGSQLGLTLKDRSLPFPSDVQHLYLRPMDFEEFLWAVGEERLANAIRRAVDERRRLSAHEEALSAYRDYVIVGGMPKAVKAFSEGHGYRQVRTIQAEIAETYAADIALYAPANEVVRAQAIWQSIPSQIARESSNKFKYSDVEPSGRRQQLELPLAWLEAAELVLKNEQTNETSAPLAPRGNGSFFKTYLLDTGILYYKLNLDAELFKDTEKRKAINPWFRGALAENYVKQSLVANGMKSYYWVPKSNPSAEIEFVVQTRTGEVVPIEVKSGRNVRSRSLQVYAEKSDAPIAIRISEKNIGIENGIFSIPLYAVFCLDDEFMLDLSI